MATANVPVASTVVKLGWYRTDTKQKLR